MMMMLMEMAGMKPGDKPGQKPGQGQGNGPAMPGTLDDHSGWDEMSEEDRELVKAKIKQAAGEAAKECDQKGQWGSVPAELRKIIKAALVCGFALLSLAGVSRLARVWAFLFGVRPDMREAR